ncbi:MAG: uracil phosphoribosyltransferase [Bdellovibrionales bacterium]
MKNLTIVTHPLAQDKLWHLRNKNTPPDNFRRLINELSIIMAYEITKNFKTKSTMVETPLQKTTCAKITENLVLVPIMRAGQAMVDGMLEMMPFCTVGHIGIYRDKFVNNTVEYYFRLPKVVEGVRIAVLDPLMATGDTAIAAISRLKEYNVGPITFVTLLIAEEGLKKFQSVHPDVEIYTLSVESKIDSNGYILPGIGDAGDRIYGTHYEIQG